MVLSHLQNNIHYALTQAWDHASSEGMKIVKETATLVEKVGANFVQPTITQARKYGPIAQEYGKKFRDLVIKTAIIFFKIAVILVLYANNTTLLFIGVGAAFVFRDEMRAAIDRISKVWDSTPWKVKVVLFIPLAFAFAPICVIAAPFVGAKVSLDLQDKAGVGQSTQPVPPPNAPPPSTTIIFYPLGYFPFLPNRAITQ